MSTRSLIALPIEDGDAAVGVYHHYDGYPTGLGMALVAARKAHHNYRSLVRTLIFDHPAGWSTIVGADWSLEPGFVDRFPSAEDTGVCCEAPYWQHYRQYYEAQGSPTPPESDDPHAPALVLGHGFVGTDKPEDYRPQCYCHGQRSESGRLMLCVTEGGSDYCIGSECDPLFMEWAYRLYPQGVEVWESVEFEGSYRHLRRARVSWDEAMPASAMDIIERTQGPRANQWGSQLGALAERISDG